MNLSVVILAAGRGKRMKSCIPKVLHEVLGMPMLQYVINATQPLKPRKTVVVIGTGADAVRDRITGSGISFVVQKKLLGTGDAVAAARQELPKGTVLVLNGDCPLITTGSLKRLLSRHRSEKNDLSLLSFFDPAVSGYGRVFRDAQDRVVSIVEEKHVSSAEKKTFNELNGGVYAFEIGIMNYLNKIRVNRSSGEYYLTALVKIASGRGRKVEAYRCMAEEIRGVNSRKELCEVSAILRNKVIEKWMDRGVTFLDPGTSVVHASARIGRDSIIYPNTYLEGTTSLGRGCVIQPGVRICSSVIGNNVIIKDNSLIEESRIGSRAVIGPFAHLRPSSLIGKKAKIGNFVEVKKSTIGDGTKASHLSYLGDAVIGKDVNIGAGTITCNYDGRNKLQTHIESGVFIGSDTQLVAPVTIGRGAYVAAGATVTKDVPSGALAISRVKQQNIRNWSKKRFSHKKDES